MPGSPTSRWATPRIRRSDHGANSPESSPATPPRPKRSTRCCAAFHPADYNGSWLLVGDRTSLFFVDFTGSGDGLAVELPPGFHVLENRALGETSPKVDLVRETLDRTPAPDGDQVVDAFRRILTDHRNPEGEARPNAANCVHLETFGTRSSCIVRVRSGSAAPRLWVADGPPCTTAYEDAGGLWDVPFASPPAQSRTSGL